MGNSMEVPQKAKNRVAEWSRNSLPGCISRQNSNSNDTCTPTFIAALFTIAKTWKQMSIDRWIDKEDVVHVYNGILLRHQNEWNAICNNMDGPRDY